MDHEDSIRRFRAELADAVSRGRQARNEAHEQAEGFHGEARELAREPAEKAAGQRQEQAREFRVRMGLAVEEFTPAEAAPEPAAGSSATGAENERTGEDGKDSVTNANNSPESQEQTPSDDSDPDFSQAQIMR